MPSARATPTAAASVGIAQPAWMLPTMAAGSTRTGPGSASRPAVSESGNVRRSPPGDGRQRLRRAVTTGNDSASARPGTCPARKSRGIEVRVRTP